MSCKIRWKGNVYTQAEFIELYKADPTGITKPAVVAENPDITLPHDVQTLLNVPGESTAKILDLNKDIELNDVDPNNTFYTKDGEKMDRLTEFASKNFSSTEKIKALAAHSPAEWSAIKYYKKKGVNRDEKIKWDKTGQDMTFEEVTAAFQKEQELNRKKGTLIHAFIEKAIKPKDKSVAERINKILEETGTPAWHYKWINNDTYVLDMLANTLGLKVGERYKGPLEDKVSSEVKVASTLLGIGSTIDMLVEHSNNSVSLYDFKTGDFFLKDIDTSDEMRHTKQIIDDIIKDNRMDKARLELMLRAFILKEQMPELRFRDIAVVHLAQHRGATVYKTSMSNYLSAIEQYYKTQRPDLYEELNKRGLFDLSSYTADSKAVTDLLDDERDFSQMAPAERAAWLSRRIEIIYTKWEGLEEDMPGPIKTKLENYTQALLDVTKELDTDFQADGKDIGYLERWFGTFYEIAQPVVQKFVRLYRQNKYRATARFNKVKNEQRMFLKPVAEEWYAKNPSRKSRTAVGLGGPIYHTENGEGMFDFMWKIRTVADTTGYYARVITKSSSGTYTDEDGKTFTKAQYEYNKWYRETLKTLYNGAMKKVVDGTKTKEDLTWGYSPYNEFFMPRVPKDHEEFLETHGIVSKENAKRAFTSMTDIFIHEQYHNQKRIGIPVKYMGSPTVITDKLFSMNTEKAMLAFAENMIYKDELDESYAIGQGVLKLLKKERDPSGKPKWDRTIGWLNDYLEGHIAGKSEEILLRRGQAKPGSVNYNRLAQSMNNVVTASSMWVAPVSGGFNTILIGIYSTSKAVMGSIARKFGIEVDYSFTDFKFATAIWLRSGLVGKAKRGFDNYQDFEANDKMHRFIQMMNFDTNTFKSSINKGDLMSAKNKVLDQSNLYLFHSIGEEFGTYTTMIAMLKSRKVKDGHGNWIKIESDGKFTPVATKAEASSMWDAYEVNETTGEFEYKGPQRGILQDGTPLNGLTVEEVDKMRRASQRMNGSYREDEKAAIEQTVIGRWLLKFKKYIPNIIAYNFQGKFHDWSLGEYQQLFDPVTREPVIKDGQTVYQWQAKVNEGRMWVALKFISYGLARINNKESDTFNAYKWENLSAEQRKLLIDTGISMTLMFMMMGAGMSMFGDDDDEKNKFARRFSSLKENIFQVHPMDLMRTASAPLLQLKYLYDFTDNVMRRFFWEGLVQGERLETGPNKGQYPGTTFIKRKVPIINIAHQFGYFNNAGPDPDVIPGVDWPIIERMISNR